MLREAWRVDPPLAFLTLFNRLFDPHGVFEGHQGVAYGGIDLSDRNLAGLERWCAEAPPERPDIPISATGNIVSGRMMAEYALRGATSGQIHTFFQLPRAEYRSRAPRSRAVLHELVFHPRNGLVAVMDGLRDRLGRKDEIRFLELPRVGRELLRERNNG